MMIIHGAGIKRDEHFGIDTFENEKKLAHRFGMMTRVKAEAEQEKMTVPKLKLYERCVLGLIRWRKEALPMMFPFGRSPRSFLE